VPTQLEPVDHDKLTEDRSATISGNPTRQLRSTRIWIDLDNTPHVPFFLPIIRELQAEGHSVIVTARDAFGVRGLLEYHGLQCRIVGRHYGANKVMKVAGTVWRSIQLFPIVLLTRPQIAMSHGSRSMELLSSLLRIPSMLLFDYEHAVRLPMLKPALGVTPEAVNHAGLSKGFKYGVRTYSGLKEDVYALTFRPDPSILGQLGVSSDEILVTVRPPATEAHYHNAEAEGLFEEVVRYLGEIDNVRMVILPRTATTQGDFIRRTWPRWCETRKIIVPQSAVDGLNLVWFSDLVVSGGGTMNREAAALGVPVYSIFRGKLGAVDRDLAREGRLVLIETLEDIRSKVHLAKRARATGPASVDRPALQQILNAARELMHLSQNGRQR